MNLMGWEKMVKNNFIFFILINFIDLTMIHFKFTNNNTNSSEIYLIYTKY